MSPATEPSSRLAWQLADGSLRPPTFKALSQQQSEAPGHSPADRHNRNRAGEIRLNRDKPYCAHATVERHNNSQSPHYPGYGDLTLWLPNDSVTAAQAERYEISALKAIGTIRYNLDISQREAIPMHGPDLRPASAWPAGESPSPRIYFARAIDGEDHAARLALTTAAAADPAGSG